MTMLERVANDTGITINQPKVHNIVGKKITLFPFTKKNKNMAFVDKVLINEAEETEAYYLKNILLSYRQNYCSTSQPHELFLHIVDTGYWQGKALRYEILLQLKFSNKKLTEVIFYDPATAHPLAFKNIAGETRSMEGEIKSIIESVFDANYGVKIYKEYDTAECDIKKRKSRFDRLYEHFKQILNDQPIKAKVFKNGSYIEREISPTAITEVVSRASQQGLTTTQVSPSSPEEKNNTKAPNKLPTTSDKQATSTSRISFSQPESKPIDEQKTKDSMGTAADTLLSPDAGKKIPTLSIEPATFWNSYRRYIGYIFLATLLGAGLGASLVFTGYFIPFGLVGISLIAANAGAIAGACLLLGIVLSVLHVAYRKHAHNKLNDELLSHQPANSSWLRDIDSSEQSKDQQQKPQRLLDKSPYYSEEDNLLSTPSGSSDPFSTLSFNGNNGN